LPSSKSKPIEYYFLSHLNGKSMEVIAATSACLMNVQLNDEKDVFVWGFTTSECFIKSLYLDLLDDDTKYLNKYILKIKVPLKIIFLCGSFTGK
jgi:hypothetical protein